MKKALVCGITGQDECYLAEFLLAKGFEIWGTSHCISEGLAMGCLDIRWDWVWAPEYVEPMWAMLQQDKPDDFVVATGGLTAYGTSLPKPSRSLIWTGKLMSRALPIFTVPTTLSIVQRILRRQPPFSDGKRKTE